MVVFFLFFFLVYLFVLICFCCFCTGHSLRLPFKWKSRAVEMYFNWIIFGLWLNPISPYWAVSGLGNELQLKRLEQAVMVIANLSKSKWTLLLFKPIQWVFGCNCISPNRHRTAKNIMLIYSDTSTSAKKNCIMQNYIFWDVIWSFLSDCCSLVVNRHTAHC